MSHNINENRMFCVGKCWHAEGIRVEKELTSKEAITAAKLDYKVVKTPLYYNLSGVYLPADKGNAIIREDNHSVLGIVGDRYKIVQNIEAFDFFDSIVGSGQAIYHSAGALGVGEKIWLLAKLPSDIIVFDNDVINKYLLLVNTHDGTGSLKMYYTPIRVVCQNTLNASSRDSKDGISIRHTQSITSKIEAAKKSLGFALDFYSEFEVNVKTFPKITMLANSKEQTLYFENCLNAKSDQSTRTNNQLDELRTLSVYGQGQRIPGVSNSLYASYNAVTEYVDYCRASRGDNKTESLLLGSGAAIKERAYTLGSVMVKSL